MTVRNFWLEADIDGRQTLGLMTAEVIEQNDTNRISLVHDEYPDEPENDGQSPLLRLEHHDYSGWRAEHVDTGSMRPRDDDDRIEEAAARWGVNKSQAKLEKYLRAYYGVTKIETYFSGNYWYVTYDSAAWREAVGSPEGGASLEEYRAWCEGDVWLWEVERRETWHAESDPELVKTSWEHVDSCGGYYGYEYAVESAREEWVRRLGESS